jgi:hypothetical protein
MSIEVVGGTGIKQAYNEYIVNRYPEYLSKPNREVGLMKTHRWCEHLDITSKYTTLKYRFGEKEVVLRVQTWCCPECGVHGAATEILNCEQEDSETSAG